MKTRNYRICLPFTLAVALAALAGCNREPLDPGKQPDRNAPPHGAKAGQLKPTVSTAELGTRFLVRVGGGTNISPPDTFGGGDGIPFISMNNGAAFMAGEVRAHDDRTKLVRIVCDFENLTEQSRSFHIGDVSLMVGKNRSKEFLAVGYESKLCAMADEDRRIVKTFAVEVPAKGTRTLSFVFAWPSGDSQQGAIVIGRSTPVPFTVTR